MTAFITKLPTMEKATYLKNFTEKFTSLAIVENKKRTQLELCKNLFAEYVQEKDVKKSSYLLSIRTDAINELSKIQDAYSQSVKDFIL